jgi:hypothetical protein
MKAFFSKGFEELPLVALKTQEKIGFHFKRNFAMIGARGVGYLKQVYLIN